MPGTDGIETIRLIEANEKIPHYSFLMMGTAGSREKIIQAENKLDINGFLTKPVTPSSILDSIMTFIGQKEANDTSLEQPINIDHNVNRLKGAKILLVEDNEVNQEFTIELLRLNDLTVTLAQNGQVALDVLVNNSFDGVLMDCQMPVMDGYTATQLIRQQVKYIDLPIIAMTANVMKGDKEKVLASGMNDHISKPINVKEMFNTMAKWITPSEIFIAPELPAQLEIKSLEVEIPNLSNIDVKAGLVSTQQNKVLYHKLLLLFYRNKLNFEQVFIAAQQSYDPQEAQRCAHSLKGSSGTIGAHQLANVAGILEQCCLEKKENIDLEITNVLSELSLVLDQLSGLKELPRKVNTLIDMSEEDINKALAKLRVFLKESNIEANDFINDLIPKLPETKYTSTLEKIESLIDEFNFDEALELLDNSDLTG